MVMSGNVYSKLYISTITEVAKHIVVSDTYIRFYVYVAKTHSLSYINTLTHLDLIVLRKSSMRGSDY